MVRPLCIEEIVWIKRGQGIITRGVIPQDSDFFKDHFPGFPVLPGVLALEMLKQTAESYLRSTRNLGRKRFALQQVRATKFSMFLKPGDAWECQLELVLESVQETQWSGKLIHDGKIAVTARFVLKTVGDPAPVPVG